MSKTALVILNPGFEEIEAVTPIDLLRRAEIEVTVASTLPDLYITGKCDMVLKADTTLAEVATEDFDILIIPGGPGVGTLRTNQKVIDLAKQYAEAGKPIAAICAAPLILFDAGLTQGKTVTGYFSIAEEMGELKDVPVVTDGLITTSRGAGTSVHFGLEIIKILLGQEKADEIAESIHWPY